MNNYCYGLAEGCGPHAREMDCRSIGPERCYGCGDGRHSRAKSMRMAQDDAERTARESGRKVWWTLYDDDGGESLEYGWVYVHDDGTVSKGI